ncbi:MAG: hypothetical protein KBS98_08245, partial [Flavobacterium sp.]|nr:hypothetical protein [Candidatus Neoflavobacterium equi]
MKSTLAKWSMLGVLLATLSTEGMFAQANNRREDVAPPRQTTTAPVNNGVDRGQTNTTRNNNQVTPARNNNQSTPVRNNQTTPTRNGVGQVDRANVDYKKNNRRVSTVRRVPNNSQQINHNQNTYQYNNGKYYMDYQGRYIQVPPRSGMRVNAIPTAAIQITFGSTNYFYSDGIYYNRYNNYYEVMEPEIGMVVSALPS